MAAESDTSKLIADCDKCADHYAKQPGTISHLTTVDLYNAIARLARIVENLTNENDELRTRIMGK